VYTRYFNVGHGGPGVYTFEVTVTDNGNTAYSWQETLSVPSSDSGALWLELLKLTQVSYLK
jgi:hypothetical protein